MVVFLDESGETLSHGGPLCQRAGHEDFRRTGRAHLDCLQRMGNAEPVGAPVGALELEIAHEPEHDVDILLLRSDMLPAGGTDRAPVMELDQDGTPVATEEAPQPAPATRRLRRTPPSLTLEALDHDTQHVLVEDGRAESRVADLA